MDRAGSLATLSIILGMIALVLNSVSLGIKIGQKETIEKFIEKGYAIQNYSGEWAELLEVNHGDKD